MRLFLAFILVLILGCSPVSESDAVSDLDPEWFNLSDFVEAKSESLKNVSISKTVNVNGAKEAKEVAGVNWLDELSPFSQSDIDRPALWDKYRIDTLINRDIGQVQIVYVALDSALFTKRIEVTYGASAADLESVSEVKVFNSLSSTIADTQQRLHIFNGGYTVESLQSARLMEDRKLSILASW